MLFGHFVSKELAPFKHAHIQKITIDLTPKITVGHVKQMFVFFVPSGAVVSHIPPKRTAQRHDATQLLCSGHRRNASYYLREHLCTPGSQAI
jgi:hypothetical protein